jgi:hypothetical protein
MTDTRQMLAASPARTPFELHDVAAAIDACFNCVQACTTCADSDLIEEDIVALRDCIALCQMCADICDAAARVLSRPGHWDDFVVRPLLEACVRACTTCADECDRHAKHHRHCAICAEACRTCAQACGTLLDAEQGQR